MDKYYDTSQITEFPRFEPESSPNTVSLFFNKFLKFPIFTQNDNQSSTSRNSEGNFENDQNIGSEVIDVETKTGTEAIYYNEGRSLQNVLRRISSLVALNSNSGTRYEDTELARYWMPDDISKECYDCGAKFSALRRRHHCRVCGQIFCSRCCSQRVPGQICGCAGGLRVCTYCCKVVLSYLKENDMGGEIGPDLKTLQENLQEKFPDKSFEPRQSKDGFMLSKELHERQDMGVLPKEDIVNIYRSLLASLPTQQHRYRLIRYNNVWRGCDLIQWIADNTLNETRTQATSLCQKLLNEGYIECLTEQTKFVDYALYRPITHLEYLDDDSVRDAGEQLMRSSISSYQLDLNLGETSARLIKSPKSDDKNLTSFGGSTLLQRNESVEQRAFEENKLIAESGKEHLTLLLRQSLSRESLAFTWLDIIMPICKKAAESVLPDITGSDIDVRNYVQIKKVSHGLPLESHIIPGVVLSKNVCHRSMPHSIQSPNILLLDCSISYQRVEGKLTSLEPVLMQEREYLVRCAARILDLKPNVVLVRGSAARKVQDILMNEGVALAVGVRLKTLRRVARCVKADIVNSIDARIRIPKLGTCKSFNIRNYNGKTLMSFEGCAEPQLGCCILLRGNSTQELVRVKKVTRFMLLAYYNWRFEYSFLIDIGAILPDPSLTFDDEKSGKPADSSNEFMQLNKNDTHVLSDSKSNDISDKFDSKRVDISDKVDSKREDISDTLDSKSGDISDTIGSTKRSSSEIGGIKNTLMEVVLRDDPLNRMSERSDSEKNLSFGVPIRDNSDPLRAKRCSMDCDEVFMSRSDSILESQEETQRFSMDDALLSISPNIRLTIPYLESEAGRKCHLRHYFHTPLFSQDRKMTLTPKSMRRKISKANEQTDVVFKDLHPFIKDAITSPADDTKIRASLANFRATGCRLPPKHFPGCPSNKTPFLKQKSREQETENVDKETKSNKDPLAPENHMHLSLLIYSFSSKSPNYPDFCISPWITKMEMYNNNDITLGAFLDKLCFNVDYKCPSRSCNTPMFNHVRRFVHTDSCITITCNTVGNSSNCGKIDEDLNDQVMWWSRCSVCCSDGAARGLSAASRRLALSKYLEWRYRARAYVAQCGHPIAEHAHYFARGLTTACFRINKVKCWDICLPAETISTFYDTRVIRDDLITRVNDLMLKGHDFFSGLADSESEKDYTVFKQQMEQINMSITSSALQDTNSLAGVVHCLWNVSDRLIFGEKLLRDAIEKWSTPTSVANKAVKNVIDSNSADEKSDLEDSAHGDISNQELNANTTSEIPPKSETEHQMEEDEEKGDRKTVRAIISQLLNNNQKANQNGLIISGGLIPIIVYYGEIGSVIAATLTSIQYQQQLQIMLSNQTLSNSAENDEPEMSPSAPKNESDARSKSTKTTSDHIEVLLKDGLLCRVYYAAQFQNLRSMLIAPLNNISDDFSTPKGTRDDDKYTTKSKEPKHSKGKSDGNVKALTEIEEGFIRSLSRCVAWTAKGGKSGSTFSKTSDDRYILKEMSKQEWQQFLAFAPLYFKYVNNCHHNKLPSLLARIVGVYSVGGAGNGVLVMENLFYGLSNLVRFDLKGNARNRLATQLNAPDAVLMDENLLQLHWDRQLYVSSHVGAVLWTAMERDTTFLSSNFVMDYSLLLGIDDDKGELVVGIIDYIRTFTWDKKLEHLVKKNLGSGQPTIVSPEQYKERFCNSMRKYFLHCPSEWDGLHRGLIGQ